MASKIQAPKGVELEQFLGQFRQAEATEIEEAGVRFLLFRDAGAGDGQAFGM